MGGREKALALGAVLTLGFGVNAGYGKYREVQERKAQEYFSLGDPFYPGDTKMTAILEDTREQIVSKVFDSESDSPEPELIETPVQAKEFLRYAHALAKDGLYGSAYDFHELERKLNDPLFMKGVVYLMQSGYPLTFLILLDASFEKLTDTSQLELRLQGLSHAKKYGKIMKKLEADKGMEPKGHAKAKKKLISAGVDPLLVGTIYWEVEKMDVWANMIAELAKKGVDVSKKLLDNISVELAKDNDLRRLLFALVERGAHKDPYFADFIAWLRRDYLLWENQMLFLAKAHVGLKKIEELVEYESEYANWNMDGQPPPKLGRSDEQWILSPAKNVYFIVKLQKRNLPITIHILLNLGEIDNGGNYVDDAYFDSLEELYEAGVDLEKLLTAERDIAVSGTESSIVRDEIKRKKILELKKNGVEIDFDVLLLVANEDLHSEESQTMVRKELENRLRLAKVGIAVPLDVTKGEIEKLLYYFDDEERADEVFINALTELQRAGLDVESLLKADDFKLNDGLIGEREKVKDLRFRKALIELTRAGYVLTPRDVSLLAHPLREQLDSQLRQGEAIWKHVHFFPTIEQYRYDLRKKAGSAFKEKIPAGYAGIEVVSRPEYLAAIKKLAKVGFPLQEWDMENYEEGCETAYGSILTALSYEQAIRTGLVDALIKLHKAKIHVTLGSVYYPAETADTGGPCVDTNLIEALTPEKTTTQAMEGMLDLIKRGVKLDANTIAVLDRETLGNKKCRDRIVDLSNEGIYTFGFSCEQLLNNEYMKTIRYLNKLGVEITRDLVSNLSIARAKNPDVVRALFQWENKMIGENGGVGAILPFISDEQLLDETYRLAIAPLIADYECGESFRPEDIIPAIDLNAARDRALMEAIYYIDLENFKTVFGAGADVDLAKAIASLKKPESK